MRFISRRRRQPPAVIIVALIDVLIVVLIFLLVTTTFKKNQPALRVSLPESSQAGKPGANENPPLELVIEPNGSLRLGPERKPVALDRLKAELAAAFAKNPKVKLTLSGDKEATWGQMIKIMDAVKESGIKAVSASVMSAGAK